MIKKWLSSKKVIYALMALLVFLWGLEYVAAKAALRTIEPLSLICIKYAIGLVLLIILKSIMDRRFFLTLKDIPVLLICSLFGTVIYFWSEYTAMSYLPVSIITIILAFVPCVSIIIELFLYKNKPNSLIVIGVLVSVIGVAMIIGVDLDAILKGKYIGYLLAISAVICWNIYNFMTKGLSKKYKPLDLTLWQQVCAVVITLPYAIGHLPAPKLITSDVTIGTLYLGVICAFIGLLIYIRAIEIIGPTSCALFSNFLPVTSTFFGWIMLSEHVSLLQLFGGLVVIASGVVVIWQKEKMLISP